MADAALLNDEEVRLEEPDRAGPLPEFFEIIDGEVVEMPPMGANEILLANVIGHALHAAGLSQGVGQAVAEMLFDLRPSFDRNRRPDVAFVTFDRWPVRKRIPRGNAWPVVPDLAVEVVSRHDEALELIEKIHEYFAAGVRLAWVVFPTVEQVYVYESTSSIRVLSRGQDLDGGAVLPGFRLALDELFGPAEDAER